MLFPIILTVLTSLIEVFTVLIVFRTLTNNLKGSGLCQMKKKSKS